jgi:hypothetical protein
MHPICLPHLNARKVAPSGRGGVGNDRAAARGWSIGCADFERNEGYMSKRCFEGMADDLWN